MKATAYILLFLLSVSISVLMEPEFAFKATFKQPTEYVAQDYLFDKLTSNGELTGISATLITQHFTLYKGYVANLNLLRKEIAEARHYGAHSIAISDRRRRLGFEYNGVVLHELYFQNMIPKGRPISDNMKSQLEASFGSYEKWEKELLLTGLTRSIGWVILYHDPAINTLTNHFIEVHENGNVAGFQPILVMDVWEHAYILDNGAMGRAAYIHSFIKNIDWGVVEARLINSTTGNVIVRF